MEANLRRIAQNGKLVEAFKLVVEIGKMEKASYTYVYNWYKKQMEVIKVEKENEKKVSASNKKEMLKKLEELTAGTSGDTSADVEEMEEEEEYEKKDLFGVVCIILSCALFVNGYHQVHNDEYMKIRGYVMLNSSAANSFYSTDTKGVGMAKLFADAYGDLFQNKANQDTCIMVKYETKAQRFTISGIILAVLGITSIIFHTIIIPKRKKRNLNV